MAGSHDQERAQQAIAQQQSGDAQQQRRHRRENEAALARRAPDDPRVAERFELYACGVELANGFGELTDPDEQRTRFAAEMDEKHRVYGERYPVDEDFLAAMEQGMPPTAGTGMGMDRLLMALTGLGIRETVLFPLLKPLG